jgi:DNA polymerase III alpha subunit
MPDIDLDFLDRKHALGIIKHIPAAIIENGTFKKHNTGVYCHSIPVNPLTGTASIDYKEADARGYFKIDFLNVSAYRGVRDEAHLVKLLSTEPVWELLYEKDVCDQLFQINGYHSLLAQLKPSSVLELATVLALIRPGKRHLVEKCVLNGFADIQDEVWTKTDDSYSYKKSHGIAYSCVIVVQLNLMCENL